MRNNQPITRVERFPEPGKPLVSKTDLQGKILYANESFVKISGFSREELMGADHNIVRHPDMPPQAFADLWRTVRAGQPWRGLVKNRTKTGDFYWVEAFVTPLTDQGRPVGYMSVRTQPARSEVSAAEALYANVRAGRAKFPETALPSEARWRKVPWMAGTLTVGALAITAGALTGGLAIGVGVLAALLAIGNTALMRRSVLRPLDRLIEKLQQLDEGRLADHIAAPRGTGSVVRAAFTQLEALRIHTRAMFADVLLSASEVESRAALLEESVASLLKVTAAQTDQISQVAAAMEQMSVSVGEIAHNTTEGMQAANRTEALAKAGKAVMAQSLESSERMASVVSATRNEIAQVDAAVSRITEITRIIRDIADQTNLLALNAAIEAARAGDQGRGFAVVADEVRKLSERTAQSTEHIGAAVGEIVQQAHAAVASMEAATADVTTAAERMRESNRGLDDIWNAANEAVRSANEITSVLRQQSAASQDVAKAMEQLSSRVEASGADTETIGSATHDLRSTAAQLRLLLRHMESALG